MLILALEQSSDLGSIALLNDEQILGEKEWNGLTERSAGLFTALKRLLSGLQAQIDDIEAYALDIGPGSYSGLRASMAAARAFALPDNKPVYAVTSAEALAFEIFMNSKVFRRARACPSTPLRALSRSKGALPLFSGNQTASDEQRPYINVANLSTDKIQVVGDARRQQWWTCVYKSDGNIPLIQSKLCLVNENDLSAELGAIIISPDWHRIGEKLKNLMSRNIPPEVACPPMPACPSSARERWPGNSARDQSAVDKKVGTALRAVRNDADNDGRPGGASLPSETDTIVLKFRAIGRSAVAESEAHTSGPNLINEKKIPKAGWLGRLVCRKMRLKMESEPLTPIYLHAAVSEKPNKW